MYLWIAIIIKDTNLKNEDEEGKMAVCLEGGLEKDDVLSLITEVRMLWM